MSSGRITKDFVLIHGKYYVRFWPMCLTPTDGTVRCIFCGQIDEPEIHQGALCVASGVAPSSAKTGNVK